MRRKSQLLTNPIVDDPELPVTTVGERIAWGRARLEWTQGQLAEAIGLSAPTSVSEWESGEVEIQQRNLKLVARALGLNPIWIMTGAGERLSESFQPPLRARGTSTVTPVPGTLRQLAKGFEIARDSGKVPPEELADMLAVVEASARSGQEIHASTPETLDLIVSALINQLTGRHRVERREQSEGDGTVDAATKTERKRSNGH